MYLMEHSNGATIAVFVRQIDHRPLRRRSIGQHCHVVLRDEAAVEGTNVEECGFRDSITCTIAASANSGGEQCQHDFSLVYFLVSRTYNNDEAGMRLC